MALTDKVEIVFSNTGRRKKVLISWLLSEDSMFAMEAAQFIINDRSIKDKIEGQTFAGKPVKPQWIMHYPYLRTIFAEAEEYVTVEKSAEEQGNKMTEEDIYQVQSAMIGEDVIEEIKTVNLPELSVEQLKSICDEREIEYDGRKRKTEYFIELIEQNGN